MRKPSDFDEVSTMSHYRINFLTYYHFSDGMNKKKLSFGGTVWATSKEEAVRDYCTKKKLRQHDVVKWSDGNYKETFIDAEQI